tara:strand:+ start:842 stop:1558 length:717 start_codon:yes stop_codon:yes gene_type:complete
MADQTKIDNIAAQVARQTDQLQQELVRDLLTLSKADRFQSIDEFLFAIEQLDVQEIVRMKAKNIMQGYTSAHTMVLKDMDVVANITEETLRSLTNFSTSTFANHLGQMGNIIKKEIVKGAIAGSTEKGIFDAIQQQAGLSGKQMETLVTTGLNDYSRSVGKVMIDQLGENQQYRYVGAIDDRTRDVCLDMWGSGNLTKEQIESRFGASVFISGGGYNCRHQWIPVQAESKSKDARTDV